MNKNEKEIEEKVNTKQFNFFIHESKLLNSISSAYWKHGNNTDLAMVTNNITGLFNKMVNNSNLSSQHCPIVISSAPIVPNTVKCFNYKKAE